MLQRLQLQPLLGIAVLAVLSNFLGGCVVWNFIDTRYQNVTGYFNSYYNATTLFAQAEEEIAIQEQSFDHPKDNPMIASGKTKDERRSPSGANAGKQVDNQRLLRREYAVPGSAVQKLDKVIEKCSRILVAYPKSKWVDDALLLIGKSYYYRKEYLKAERKFNELIDRFPESSLASEAVLWLGKTHSMTEQWDLAEAAMNRAIELGIKEQNPEIVADSWYNMGEMYIDRGMEEEAVKAYKNGAEYAASRDQRLRIQIALAKEQEKLGNKKEAAEAYRDIIKLNPSSDQMFIAELNYARLCRETGDAEGCANTLLDMLDNPTYLQYDGKIQLEIGHYFSAIKEYPAAIDQYVYVDTTFKNTPESAEAGYAMGQLYETKLMNYDKAFEKYTRARQASQGLAASRNAALRSDVFGDYRKFRNKMYDTDTLMYFVLHPDSLARRDSLQVIADSLDRERTGRKVVMTEEQAAAERFARRRPHGRNTGRINPYLVPTAQIAGAGGAAPAAAAGVGLPLYRRVKLSSVSPDSLLGAISAMRMEMGWIMLDKIVNRDSAAYYYRFALDGKLPDSLKAQAYFTLAEISRQQNNAELAAQYEDILMRDFPQTGYAWTIMKSRGLTPPDTSAFLKDMYNQAAALLESGSYEAGIKALERLIDSYPKSAQAQRARLAIAMTYEGPLKQGDKAIALYRAMIADNPASPYSKRGREVLALLDAPKTPPIDSSAAATKAVKPVTPNNTKPATPPRPRPNRFRDEDNPGGAQDSTRAKKPGKDYDPSNDADFPLGIPGDTPAKPGTNPGGKPDVKPTNPGGNPTPTPQSGQGGNRPPTLPSGGAPQTTETPPSKNPPPQPGKTP